MDNDLMKDGIRNQLNDFIKQTWEVIGNYQNAITSLQTLENQGEIIPIIEDIISDNMIHVGQLQKALELMVPEVIDKISEGEKQAELTLSEEPDEGELEEVEVEVQEPEVSRKLFIQIIFLIICTLLVLVYIVLVMTLRNKLRKMNSGIMK